MPQTPIAVTKRSTVGHRLGTTAADNVTALTASTVLNINGVINTVGNFVKAGVMRQTSVGYSICTENDPNVLSVHSLL